MYFNVLRFQPSLDPKYYIVTTTVLIFETRDSSKGLRRTESFGRHHSMDYFTPLWGRKVLLLVIFSY